MSDADEPRPVGEQPGDGSEPGSDTGSGPGPVGSVGEEAAKLFGALSDWARDQGGEQLGGAGEALAAGFHELGDHVATGGEDCRYCPVCQVIHVVRQTSPEVRAHLAVAASSLMQAAAGLLETRTPPARGPVEHIDLDPDQPGAAGSPEDPR